MEETRHGLPAKFRPKDPQVQTVLMAGSRTVIKAQYLLYFVFWLLALVLLVAACENIYFTSQTSWTPEPPTCPRASLAREHSQLLKARLAGGPQQGR